METCLYPLWVAAASPAHPSGLWGLMRIVVQEPQWVSGDSELVVEGTNALV